MPKPSSGLHIEDEEFRRFCEFFYRRTGIIFSESKRYYVDRRLIERIQATGSTGFQSYFSQLRTDPDEQERLINAFTVNETYFFREEHQLRCLTESLLGHVVQRKKPSETIRIWSLPCSTGEEPYSIAIWLLEHWPAVDAWNIEIVGSDIDTHALAQAEAGLYSERSLMRLPGPVIDKYFRKINENSWQIAEALRSSVSFSQVNIIDKFQMAPYRDVDIIFCRNVLIYFDDASRREAAENIFDSLAPGGWVCLGHTESMSRISPLFRVCRLADAIVYQKREGAET